MRIKTSTLAIIVLVMMLGGIFASSQLGYWKTAGSKDPAKIKEGAFAGLPDPADIRGSYAFSDISKAFDIPLEDLGKAFHVQDPTQYASFKCKDLETIYASLAESGTEIGTSSVRYFVSLYKGIPITLTEESYLPTAAVEILKAKASLTPEQIIDLDLHTVDLTNASLPETSTDTTGSPASTTENPTAKPTGGKDPALREVRGSTTFQDLLGWGLSKEEIEQVVGVPMPAASLTIRNYALEKGVEFSEYKTALQTLLDKQP